MAIKAPKVQSLSQAMASLNPAFAGQISVINQQQAGLGAKYDAQRSALTAEKGQGFNAINNQATGRGGSFSGVPVDEQATYLSTKYLPGMQQADYQQNEEKMGFNKEKAALSGEQRVQALGRIDKQKSDLNQWNLQRLQQEAAAREARLQRQWQTQQAQRERQFQAQQNAADRAASAAQAAASRAANAPKKLTPYEAAFGIISNSLGSDGYVSPGTFQLARDMYTQSGGKASDFASKFWKYTGADDGQKNQKNWKSYYYG